MAPKSYHHGDLKNAALAVAESLLDEAGADGLTLREVARRLEVSHAALYRHYPDRNALLADVAHSGFQRLLATLARASKGDDADEALLRRLFESYIAFARKNAPIFRLMYGPEVADRSAHPELAKAVEDTMTIASERVAAAQASGYVRAGVDPGVVAASAFALAHGIAALTINGLLRNVEPLREMPREAFIAAAWDGFWRGAGA